MKKAHNSTSASSVKVGVKNRGVISKPKLIIQTYGTGDLGLRSVASRAKGSTTGLT